MPPGVPGTCVLAIVSLVDIDGDIPSKPHISGPDQAGVVATWGEVSKYVQVLSESCLVQRSKLGWTSYGKLTSSPSIISILVYMFFGMFADARFLFSRLLEDSTLGIFLWARDSVMNRRVPQSDLTGMSLEARFKL